MRTWATEKVETMTSVVHFY